MCILIGLDACLQTLTLTDAELYVLRVTCRAAAAEGNASCSHESCAVPEIGAAARPR